jgi:hypothetical protein
VAVYWLAHYLLVPAWALASLYIWLARPLAPHREALRLYARLLILNGLMLTLMCAASVTGTLVAAASGTLAGVTPDSLVSLLAHLLALGWGAAGSLMAGYPILRTREAR